MTFTMFLLLGYLYKSQKSGINRPALADSKLNVNLLEFEGNVYSCTLLL